MKNIIVKLIALSLLTLYVSCGGSVSSNAEMINLLAAISKSECVMGNAFCPQAEQSYYDSVLNVSKDYMQVVNALYCKSNIDLELGNEQASIDGLNDLEDIVRKRQDYGNLIATYKSLAIAYLRLGERTNCIYNHSGEACVFPIQGDGVHTVKTGSSKAIEIYQKLLQINPNDYESRWLLNIAYMTIGGYPKDVPKDYLIKGLGNDSIQGLKPFTDIAINIGLNTNNLAGGAIIDDFNNDGYLDLITSSWSLEEGMHYCQNKGNSSFRDVSAISGLKAFTGGLNIMQTDYNNDGFKDIFVLRGAWKGIYGREPNSLLRNNGDGTFTDVTKESGLLSYHPTQTATWADFNNDGWLDVFIGNESGNQHDQNPCEFYINNKNGTFTNIAKESGAELVAFVKGVTSGDFDNDGWVDIFVSTLGSEKFLLKNEGIINGIVHFKNVTKQAGLGSCTTRTFPTWFWDYDNDGWLDIMLCGYEFQTSLAYYAGAEAMHQNVGNAAKQFLFRNKHDGTFEDITDKVGLNKTAFAMGANFGDIDNDGYNDIYLGTGNPLYQSLVPNKMFRNEKGKSFTDVTTAMRTGNLQKGHGVSFADLDNDGDEDVYIEMGGAYAGDAYQNSLYINPGQNNNNWIGISLEGTKCNKAAIGTKLKITFKENGIERSVYHDVNSGASFGSNPLRQHIGIGQASMIESIEIKWAGNHNVQVFKNVAPNRIIKITEGSDNIATIQLAKNDFTTELAKIISCGQDKIK